MTSQVLGSDWTGGATRPHYVDGRLLTAADLLAGQDVLLGRDRRVARAAGAGVVHGLDVTGSATTLTIGTGLGINRSGDPVEVPSAITVPLTSATLGQQATTSGFSCCSSTTPDGTTTGVPVGRYVLVARPDSRVDGSSPLAPPPTGAVSAGCGPRWDTGGVQLRVVLLPIGTTFGRFDVTELNSRNVVAHWCLGTLQLQRIGIDPFSGAPTGVDPAYGGLDTLDAGELTDDDLPLAVFAWDGRSLSDLDSWSARRRVTRPAPLDTAWATGVADRREADGQARLLQFQDEVEQLVGAGLAGRTQVGTSFAYLPPLGFLPLRMPELQGLADSLRSRKGGPAEALADEADLLAGRHAAVAAAASVAGGQGFDPNDFFGTLARYGGALDWDVVEVLLQQSWRATAVPTDVRPQADDASRDHDTTPITWYYVMQNVLAYLTGLAAVARGRKPRTFGRRDRFGPKAPAPANPDRPDLYVVFVANRHWLSDSTPPFIDAYDGIGG